MEKPIRKPLYAFLFIAILVVIIILIAGEKSGPKIITASDYAGAEKFLGQNTNPLVFGASVRPAWIDKNRFWYKNTMREGSEFVLVNANEQTRQRVFDHEKLANAISELTGESYKAFELPISQLDFSGDMKFVIFNIGSKQYSYDLQENNCKENVKRNGKIKTTNGKT